MDDRYEDVFRQYDLKISNVYRARGALLLDTDKGYKLFRVCQSSNSRIEHENSILSFLVEQGYQRIDSYYPNLENQIISQDSSGDRYFIKNWYQGDECNLKDVQQVRGAAKNLAMLHKLLNQVSVVKERSFAPIYLLPALFSKHNKELKRVKSYILDKKQKNEFEVRFLSVFDRYYEQGIEAEKLLNNSSFEQQKVHAEKNGTVNHGSYTYHNIMMTNKGIVTTNFEKADVGLQIFDLYYFMRKTMEKNSWDIYMANQILDEYFSNFVLAKDQLDLLYILMLYPEKFWKITNYYFNSKKSWISGRTIQKLVSLQQQEEQKNLFLQNLESYYIMNK
ncbi:CotS family spore coat protein [Anaeromicropila populeti]|uniref:Spore coat protein, CotS family n=1 Tax=Anaeromicropila populeti TaxID=37658 RepID=A0A1I6I614_9FIRM|nr:CotS family spore coat protein [Anaeromicropila populeti]SFR62099.1 spore coat protein, CotS family [Anaeromicropila populeti]